MIIANRRIIPLEATATITLTMLLVVAVQAAPARDRKPNIVFFLVDDMGWMDSTVYGSRYYETPNMERLAERSMMFTDAYAANPLCSPTRASILTGKWPARLRITTPACHLRPLPDQPLLPDRAPPHVKTIFPRSKRFLPPDERTIAEVLKQLGYRTAHIGKWHLGIKEEHWPDQQGFDVTRHGTPDPGPPSYHSPYGFPRGTLKDGPTGEYITDRLTDEAVAFIEANKQGPFLLHLWHYGVHGPWGHKEEITKRFASKKDPRGKQANPIMASMLKSVDESLGRVMGKLDELGLADDTIIIFFSDNGGNIHSNTEADNKRAPKGSRRWKLLQDWRKWADHLPPTNNAPLRGGKATIFEGGYREPMLVCWPGVVEPGSTCGEPVVSVDFYPTLLEIVGGKPQPGQVLDGVSLMPLLKQTGGLKREAVFCHFPHNFGDRSPAATAVRKGDWKLIRVYATNRTYPDRYMLYNLAKDIGETTNLASKMPDRVKELDALIDRFLKDTDALVPKPNPAYRVWGPSKDTKAVETAGLLRISSDVRPFVQTREVPPIKGSFVVRFRMRTSGGTPTGRVYWATESKPGYARERFEAFRPAHDGSWKEYTVKLSVPHALVGIRIDPALSAAQAEFDWIKLCGQDGKVLRTWDFGGAAKE